jgi:cupin 2 domain-containing protein
MTSNLFSNLPSNLPDELFTTLLEATKLRIERIVSEGHSSPEGFWYDQDQHEWVLALKGAARLSIERIVRELRTLVCAETGSLAGVLATTYDSSVGSSETL